MSQFEYMFGQMKPLLKEDKEFLNNVLDAVKLELFLKVKLDL